MIKRTLLMLLCMASALNAQQRIPDVEVLMQTGESKRFYTDLVKDKVVVMQFVFTECGMICPMLGVKFQGLQQRLGRQLGDQVHLLSISIDPSNDTPEKMRQWAAQFDAKSGWDQITGQKTVIDGLLKSLQSFAPERDSHSALLLMGNESAGVWKRMDGKTSLTTLNDEVQQLLALNAH